MRAAITICLNAEKHLTNWGDNNAKMFDIWVIVEGAVSPNGCTSWCKPITDKWVRNHGRSRDNTCNILDSLTKKYDNIHVIQKDGLWNGKMEMFNNATMLLNNTYGDKIDYLWQADADEYWLKEDIESAEKRLAKNTWATCSTFLTISPIYICKDYSLVLRGEWGEGRDNNFRRLWKWRHNFSFHSHEPPRSTPNERSIGWALNPERCLHLSYFYDEDVKFKSEFYREHELVHAGWKETIEVFKKSNIKRIKTSSMFMNRGIGQHMNNSYIEKTDASKLDRNISSLLLK